MSAAATTFTRWTTPASSIRFAQPDPRHERIRSAKFRAGLIQMRSGRTLRSTISTRRIRLIGEASAAGADYVQTPEMTNIMEALARQAVRRHRGARTRMSACPRSADSRGTLKIVSAYRLARDQGVARQGREPRRS